MSTHPLKKAVLVGIQLPKTTPDELQNSLDELRRLVTTLGYEVIGQVTQKRGSDRSSSVLGEGKLKELARWTGGDGVIEALFKPTKTKAALKREAEGADAVVDEEDDDQEREVAGDETAADSSENEILEGEADIVIVDTDLSPSQLRNLESASGAPVLDRTGVIIEIFSRHAKTRAARLQVEIARLTYVAPRLRAGATGGDQQGGGGKGAGETKLELDKRNIRDRIKELKTELASIDNEHEIRRARRQQENTVALVGYTNAGKSSLMRALTGSEIYVADKLFATLDTTIRPMQPESIPKVLISDTVGFIKKLPHDLVASFKSTLDEALHASLLLFVVDASDPSFRAQYEVTRSVLNEVGAVDAPSLLIMNKRDCLSPQQLSELKLEFPDAIFISTRDKEDLKMIRSKILSYFEGDMIEESLLIPFHVQGVIGEVRRRARVLSESYTDKGVTLKLRAHPEVLAHLNEIVKGK